ncbi:AAA family ATPase [Bifidobacterium eulemuris]|nr:AAA family ATPase [Bifidobacterium eulemuris]
MPGAGMRPPELVGRDADIESIGRIIARTKLKLMNQGVIFSGLRGMGKTVLLLSLQDLAARQGMVTARMEATGNAETDYDELFNEIALAAVNVRSMALREKLSEVMSRIDSVEFSFLGIGANVRLSDEERIRTNPFRLEAIVRRLSEELAKENSGLFLFIDELQEMASKPLGALVALQHKMGQDGLPFYIIGAGLPNLPGTLTKSRSYAERLFSYKRIGQLSDEDTADGFQKPAQRMGRPFDDEAISRLVEISHGYPYFIQAYGRAAWDASVSNPTGLQAVLEGEPIARAELDEGLYTSRWQRAKESGRRYLAAMARISEDDPCDSARVAEAMGKKPKEVSMVRESLIQLGLIYQPEHGKVAYTIPGMGEYILRAVPATQQTYDGRW